MINDFNKQKFFVWLDSDSVLKYFLVIYTAAVNENSRNNSSF